MFFHVERVPPQSDFSSLGRSSSLVWSKLSPSCQSCEALGHVVLLAVECGIFFVYLVQRLLRMHSGHHLTKLATIRSAIRVAAGGEQSGMLRVLTDCYPEAVVDEDAVRQAAVNDHLDLLLWMHKRMGTGMVHLKVVRWLVKARGGECSAAPLHQAAKCGQLQVVEWLYKHSGCMSLPRAMDEAAACGHLNVMQFLHARGGRNDSKSKFTAMTGAAVNGHLDVVKRLHDHRDERCNTDAMDGAASNGHFNVVQWLHDHRSEGCSPPSSDEQCCEGGH